MIQRLSAGLSIALFALLLPNALALNSPDLPASLLNKLSRSANSLQSMGGQTEKTTDTQSASGDGSARSDGALLMRHKVFYLRR
ncbi:MAG: hypothetical protein ACYDC7_00035, partial [Acidithiobacillus ferrivorans]